MDLCDCCHGIADCNYTLIGKIAHDNYVKNEDNENNNEENNGEENSEENNDDERRWEPACLVFYGVDFAEHFIDEDDYGYITKDVKTKEELLDFLPWISFEENDNDNFCVKCIKQLIVDKKIFFHCIRRTVYPLYTDCCDKLLYKDAHSLSINHNFPYVTTFSLWSLNREDEDTVYYQGDLTILGKRDYVNLYCEECFSQIKDRFTENDPLKDYDKDYKFDYRTHRHEKMEDYYYRIKPIDHVIDFKKNGKNGHVSLGIVPLRDHYFLTQELAKELSYYIGRRNLNIVITKYYLSKNSQNYILKLL